MKAIVTAEFKALRNPKDKKNSLIEEGEVVEGNLAKWAVENGHGEEAPDDATVGKDLVERRPPPRQEKRRSRRDSEDT